MFLLTRKRLEKGWSRSELARRARIHTSDMSKIENGRVYPYESQIKKIAKALGHPVKEAFELMEEVKG